MAPRDEVTALLNEAARGDASAIDRLMPLLYDELVRLAHHHRFRWRDGRALGTKSLVHEAYLKLVDQSDIEWKSRAHFFYVASCAMRSILIDNARYHARQKREGGRQQVPLSDDLLVSEERSDELLSLDDAVTRLKASDERLGKIVECRFYGGLTIEEVAEALDLSPATVKRAWSVARAWLYQELQQGAAPV